MSGVLIMAGGTGGHVFPGLAVARELIARGIRVAWLGTPRGIETRAVPAAGLPIEIEYIDVRGVRHKGWRAWLLLPFTLAYAMGQAFRVLRRQRPDVVLSFGGFVAGPGGLMAWVLRIPLLIHEANAIPGFTNKWLALFARQILTGFPDGFNALAHARQVGNPVRAEIAAIAPPVARLADRRGRLRVLVVGGSQGAQAFNEIVPLALKSLPPAARPQLRHQCGRNQRDITAARYEGIENVEVFEFIQDMADAYAWADVVIARAGAMTVAELAAAGCCAVLVPYPHAVDDHQTANARYLMERQAAVLLPQPEFTPTRAADAADAVASACEEVLR